MKESRVCSVCGTSLKDEPFHDVGGRLLCDDCFCEHTVTCDNCGDRIMRNESEGDNMVTLCRHCYEYSYTHCEDCNCLLHNDDARYEDDSDYAYCEDCYQKLQEKAIKNYNFKPEPIFFGSGNLFYGVELEVDKGGEYEENAQILLNIANKNEERIYCKHDGSLNDGFEIVSHPMSLDYHINNMNWLEILEKATDMNYCSHNTSTCGLHIHCSRSAFGADYDEQERAIGRLVFFFERHWGEMVKLSRRTADNLEHWASRYATISSTTEETYKKAKNKHMGRYVAVNLQNYNTIEIRLFRGSLRYKTFISALQLVDEICRCAINLSDEEIEDMSWSDFVLKIPQEKSELVEYLKSKNLYMNEPVQESEEI